MSVHALACLIVHVRAGDSEYGGRIGHDPAGAGVQHRVQTKDGDTVALQQSSLHGGQFRDLHRSGWDGGHSDVRLGRGPSTVRTTTGSSTTTRVPFGRLSPASCPVTYGCGMGFTAPSRPFMSFAMDPSLPNTSSLGAVWV